MTCHRGSTFTLTFTRSLGGGSWDSAKSSRIPATAGMTADQMHATLFGSTQRGAATAATPSYIHGGVAACLRCTVCGEGGNIIVYLLSVLYLSCGIFLRFLALRIISQKAMRYLVKYISLYINMYVNKYIYTWITINIYVYKQGVSTSTACPPFADSPSDSAR